jgi:hypothetical protein
MAGRINWIADVTDHESNVFKGHSIVVRENVARLSNGARDVAVVKNVATVTLLDARHARITFDNGQVWSVERPARKSGCGCGR